MCLIPPEATTKMRDGQKRKKKRKKEGKKRVIPPPPPTVAFGKGAHETREGDNSIALFAQLSRVACPY